MSATVERRRVLVELLVWGLVGFYWGWRLRADKTRLVPDLVVVVAMVLATPAVELLSRHVPAVRRWREKGAAQNRVRMNRASERGRAIGVRAGRWVRRALGRGRRQGR